MSIASYDRARRDVFNVNIVRMEVITDTSVHSNFITNIPQHSHNSVSERLQYYAQYNKKTQRIT